MILTSMCFVSHVWQHIRAGDNLDDIDTNAFCVTGIAAHQGKGFPSPRSAHPTLGQSRQALWLQPSGSPLSKQQHQSPPVRQTMAFLTGLDRKCELRLTFMEAAASSGPCRTNVGFFRTVKQKV
jgi:hypothetical protein